MKPSTLTFVTFVLAATLLLTPFLVGLTSSTPYDAWADLDADGDIDIFDIVKIAGTYGTTGDPGKNVSVTNWPTCEATTIWFRTPLNSTWIYSPSYNAYGFGHLHISVHVACLSQDANATASLYSTIWDASHTERTAVNAWTIQFTGQTILRYNATTIPVPGEEFYFSAHTTPVLNNAQIYLSFYLTWS